MDTPINPDIELRKKINLEKDEILRHEKALQELRIRQKRIGLRRLEMAISTFTDGACFLKLSEDGNAVRIYFEDGNTQDITVDPFDRGIKMLYNVLKYGFIGVKSE